MATCKDCLHCMACRDLIEALRYNAVSIEQEEPGAEEWCETFRDAAAVPPCKIGDVVYMTDGARVYESRIKHVIYDTDSIGFDETAIGSSVYLTRAEAENALQDRIRRAEP